MKNEFIIRKWNEFSIHKSYSTYKKNGWKPFIHVILRALIAKLLGGRNIFLKKLVFLF